MLIKVALFAISYLSLIVIGTLTVGGWFFSTRGRVENLPDGTVVKRGKIFKGFYFFWMQETGTERIFYKLNGIIELMKEIRATGQIPPGVEFNITVQSGVVSTPWDGAAKVLTSICEQLDIKVLVKGDGYFSFYKEYPVFRFPEWVRDPLAKCATCHASVYGSLFYWVTYPFAFKHLYSWMEMPILAPLIFWVIFCFSLAIPLTALAKKYN